MSRVDWIVLRRIAARVSLTVTVFFGLLCLVQTLDTGRFKALSRIGGPQLAVFSIVTDASRQIMGTLSVTVLLGVIIGALDLQSRREMTVIAASGISVWRVVRAPVIAAVIVGFLVGGFGNSFAIQMDRLIPGVSRANTAQLWLEQTGSDGDYVMVSQKPNALGQDLQNVQVFFTSGDVRDRVEATSARLSSGYWQLKGAVRYRPDTAPHSLPGYKIATKTTMGDMQVRLTSPRDLTLGELWNAVSQQLADPALRAGATTMLMRLVSTPALLAGSVLMGFAFTSGYRRTNKYGAVVLYGIVLGFVVYVVTELADRSGFAGVVDPAFAAIGPAFVAIVIGVTVLLYREDGRA